MQKPITPTIVHIAPSVFLAVMLGSNTSKLNFSDRNYQQSFVCLLSLIALESFLHVNSETLTVDVS